MDTELPRACLHSCLSCQCCLDVMQMGEVLGWRAGTARSKNPFGTTVGWGREEGPWEGEEMLHWGFEYLMEKTPA